MLDSVNSQNFLCEHSSELAQPCISFRMFASFRALGARLCSCVQIIWLQLLNLAIPSSQPVFEDGILDTSSAPSEQHRLVEEKQGQVEEFSKEIAEKQTQIAQLSEKVKEQGKEKTVLDQRIGGLEELVVVGAERGEEIVRSREELGASHLGSSYFSVPAPNSLDEFLREMDRRERIFRYTDNPNHKVVLENFVKKLCPDIGPEEAWAYANKGISLLKEYFEHQTITYSDVNELPRLLVWGCTLYALAQKKKVLEGMFVIEDPDGQLMESLKQHPHKYRRWSSHFQEKSPQEEYGIDQQKETMPTSKRTILFGSITLRGQSFLYLKPENYGCNFSSLTIENVVNTVGHTGEYLQSCLSKSPLPFVHPVGGRDSSLLHKEHLGERCDLIELCHNITEQIPPLGQNGEEFRWFDLKQTRSLDETKIKKHGISAIMPIFDRVRKQVQSSPPTSLSPTQEEILDRMAVHLSSWHAKGLDHFHLRKGSEIIITRDNMVTESP